MALYDFKCIECGNIQEEKLSFEQHDKIKDGSTILFCKKCGGFTKQAVAPLRFDLKGAGWFGKDGSGTGYEITQRELDRNTNEESRFEDYANKQIEKDKSNK